MLNITVIAVGSLKESYFTAACAEYQKRLSAFCKLRIIEVGEFRLGQNPGAAEIERGLAAEGKAIIAKLPQKAAVIPLCIEGKPLSSPQLAGKIEDISANCSHIVFVIGGSHGLLKEVKQLGQLSLSMSGMTFPHQLARVMLLEQIYRALSISGGLKYHK